MFVTKGRSVVFCITSLPKVHRVSNNEIIRSVKKLRE